MVNRMKISEALDERKRLQMTALAFKLYAKEHHRPVITAVQGYPTGVISMDTDRMKVGQIFHLPVVHTSAMLQLAGTELRMRLQLIKSRKMK